MRRTLALGMIALASSGCFHWAPVTSLADVDDDSVRVISGSSTVELAHASARGRYIVGAPIEGAGALEPVGDCVRPACVAVEVTHANVVAKRLNVGVTAAIVISCVIGAAATLFAAAVAAFTASRPIPEGF